MTEDEWFTGRSSQVTASSDPIYDLKAIRAVLGYHSDGRYVGLVCKSGGRVFTLALPPDQVLEHLVGDLIAIAKDVLRQDGLEARDLQKAVREIAREARLAEQRTASWLQTSPEMTCGFCSRPTSVIVEGTRYCKRHAEEHGVREHGKIT